jgi:hypothetical protein
MITDNWLPRDRWTERYLLALASFEHAHPSRLGRRLLQHLRGADFSDLTLRTIFRAYVRDGWCWPTDQRQVDALYRMDDDEDHAWRLVPAAVRSLRRFFRDDEDGPCDPAHWGPPAVPECIAHLRDLAQRRAAIWAAQQMVELAADPRHPFSVEQCRGVLDRALATEDMLPGGLSPGGGHVAWR